MIVIGSTQKHAFIGNGDYAPCINAAMGLGGGHIPMIILNMEELNNEERHKERSICIEIPKK